LISINGAQNRYFSPYKRGVTWAGRRRQQAHVSDMRALLSADAAAKLAEEAMKTAFILNFTSV